jgi:hypothetical protein
MWGGIAPPAGAIRVKGGLCGACQSGSGSPGPRRADWRLSRAARPPCPLEVAEANSSLIPSGMPICGSVFTRRISSRPISAVRCASALLMDSESWFAVDVFEPKTTTPPNRAARPAIITIGSNVMTPRVVAAIRIPPSADAAWSAPAPPSREKGRGNWSGGHGGVG